MALMLEEKSSERGGWCLPGSLPCAVAWAGLGMSGTQEVPARLQTRAGSRSCLDRAPGNAAFCAMRILTWPAAYRAAQKRHRNSGRSHLIVRFAQRVHKSLWPVHTNCRSLSSSFQLARCWHWVHPGHRQKAGQMDVGEGVGPANSRKCRCPGCDALLCLSPGPGDRRVTALSLFPTCPSAWWWFVCCLPVPCGALAGLPAAGPGGTRDR